MTVCIAAMAENGTAVIVAADKMITASGLALAYDHDGTKVDRLNNKSVAMTSGDALVSWEVIHGLAVRDDITFAKVAEAVGERYCEIRNKRLDDSFFRPVGFTLEKFMKEGQRAVPANVFNEMIQHAGSFCIDLHVLLAGVDDRGAHISTVMPPQKAMGVVIPYDRIGYHAIGSGALHASITLALSRHSVRAPIELALYNVCKAKRAAEVSPGVGNLTNMAVITASGIKDITDELIEKMDEAIRVERGNVPDLSHIKEEYNALV